MIKKILGFPWDNSKAYGVECGIHPLALKLNHCIKNWFSLFKMVFVAHEKQNKFKKKKEKETKVMPV